MLFELENSYWIAFFIGIPFTWLLLHWGYRKMKYVLPPGPIGLPLVGYLPFQGREPFRMFQRLSEKYGDVFGLYLGRSYTFVVNDFESSKEALNNPVLVDRPPGLFKILPGGLGFMEVTGKEFIEQRRYTMKILKTIGISKIPWEMEVEDEVADLVKILEEQAGNPVDLIDELSASVSNNITTLVLGKRLLAGDPRRNSVDDGVNAAAMVFASTGIWSSFPGLLRLINTFGISNYFNKLEKLTVFNIFIRNEIERCKTISPSQLHDDIFIEGYLQEIKKMQETKSGNFFNEKNLVGTSQALMIGGSETTRTSLMWLFLAMASHLDIQKKIQNEIDRVLGRDGKLKWSERNELPYTYATVMEGQRWRSITPLNFLRRASEDTKISCYDVPAGTNVLINIWALHNDPKYWKDPESFVPDRFLASDGSLVKHRLDSYLPFSMGRRSCPGETIALIEIFRYFTAIMQKFHIWPLKDQNPVLDGILGITYKSHKQKLRFVARG